MNRLFIFIFFIFGLISASFTATYTITVKVDKNGTARAYIKGLGENDTVSISAKTSDPLVPAKSGEVIVKNYASKVELPTYNSTLYGTEANTADYKEDFTVTASNLMPGTTVKWSATNGITPKTETTTIGEDGKTSVEFNANADYSIKDSDITMEYHQSVSQTLTNTKNLKFKQYTLALTTNKSEIVGDEQYVATLSGGKPGEAVTWTVTGDSQLVSKQDKFDSNGKATYTGKGKSPYSSAIKVRGTVPFYSNAYKEQSVAIYTAGTLTLPTYSSTLYGTEANTADYNTVETIKASKLVPNSTIVWTSSNSGVKFSNGQSTMETTANASGESSVQIQKMTDYSIKNTVISYTYKGRTTGVTASGTLKFKQYTLALTTNKSEIVGDEQYVATLSGGKPGEAVTWTVTGDSQLVSKQDKFDSNGKATYTAQGKSPFTTKITVKPTTRFGGSKTATVIVSPKIAIEPLETNFKIIDSQSNCNVKGGRNEVIISGGIAGESITIKPKEISSFHTEFYKNWKETLTFDSNGQVRFYFYCCYGTHHRGAVDTLTFTYHGKDYVFTINHI